MAPRNKLTPRLSRPLSPRGSCLNRQALRTHAHGKQQPRKAAPCTGSGSTTISYTPDLGAIHRQQATDCLRVAATYPQEAAVVAHHAATLPVVRALDAVAQLAVARRLVVLGGGHGRLRGVLLHAQPGLPSSEAGREGVG